MMSDTTTADIRAGFIECGLGDGSYLDQDDVRALNASEFDAWLKSHDAEVERAAAARALEEFAEQWATRDGIEALMFATDDVSAVQATEKSLLARAEVYRREGKE